MPCHPIWVVYMIQRNKPVHCGMASVVLYRGHSVSSMMMMMLLMLLLIKNSSGQSECRELSCGPSEPHIRFPFQLVKGMQDGCGLLRICLYCTPINETMILFPSIKLRAISIDYKRHIIQLTDPDNCLPKKFLQINNFVIHHNQVKLTYEQEEGSHLSFFNCSSVGHRHLRNYMQSMTDAQDMISCPIYVSYSYESILQLDLTSCTKMFDSNASTKAYNLRGNFLRLRWFEPTCVEGDIECFDCKRTWKRIHVSRAFIFATTGSIILGLVVVAFFKIIRHFRKKEEDQARVDKFLEDYRAENPTRFTYADLKRITGAFKEKLGEGAHGAVFRGKLSNEIMVAVKVLDNTEKEGNDFINEVGIMGKIHHINVVRLLGFCAEGTYRALVYNFFPNGSLQSFIFPPDDKEHFLGWEKLQHIALGIAKGIEYLHQGCTHPIIHFDINPHNVLLDDNFNPKISDFGLAKLCSKNPSLVSMTAARGTLGYIAPEVFSRNFGNVSYKSDIYSYGMLLLEMVGGRKNIDMSSAQNSHVLYPDWIHDLVDGDVHIHVEDDGDVKL
ncbi:hypothetical protein Fmac_032047 [Flemingia macrophylla]|uniref:non-specific serine/threonine protein kinase n=1 Tax=Flemingia macrophylla TaxID=520843 RepID=A0ABD1L3T7_9FABA